MLNKAKSDGEIYGTNPSTPIRAQTSLLCVCSAERGLQILSGERKTNQPETSLPKMYAL